ncbi:hypothetical protein OAB88_04385 [Winogradskyella sp.]|nr:hypothetical protein [Winogradskyella sp.]
MEAFSKSLEYYKSTYKTRLAEYRSIYEDNTKAHFYQKELDTLREVLEILDTYKKKSKTYEFQTLKAHFEISTLKNSGFNLDKVDNHINSIKSIMAFINSLLTEDNLSENINENEVIELRSSDNPYPYIFKNGQCYELFQRLYDHFKSTRYPLADFSFIYRKMHKDGHILDSFKPQMFANWVNEKPYEIPMSKIKTMSDCSTLDKIRTYDMVKASIQSK